jgi:hypothetical protein
MKKEQKIFALAWLAIILMTTFLMYVSLHSK